MCYGQPSDIDDMSKNGFLIGIQTSFQRDMLVQFGPTAICMDSTHSTNAYDFFLITILVLDDLGEEVSIAWITSTTRKRVAPNTNFEKQTHFKSTKKQHVSSKKSLSTPSDQEKGHCIEKMNEIDIAVCGICLKRGRWKWKQTCSMD